MKCKYCKRYIHWADWLCNLGKCDYCNYQARKREEAAPDYNEDTIQHAVKYWENKK